MFKFNNRRVVLRLTIFALFGCCFGFLASGTARRLPGIASEPQGAQDRVIEKKKNSPSGVEPVEITLVRTKRKREVGFGKPFQDDDEWFQGLTVTAKNISTKNITYIKIYFSFERPEDSDGSTYPPLIHSLVYGSHAFGRSKDSKSLARGNSIDLSLSDSSYASLKRALRKLGYPASIDRLQMYLSEVIFEDETMWANGYWFRRDPTDHQNWILIQKEGALRGPPGLRDAARVAGFAHSFLAAELPKTMTALPLVQGPGCGLPGNPYLQTCVGASNSDCKKEYTPVYTAPSPQYATHKGKTVFITCMQCTRPTPSSIDCNPANHCEHESQWHL